MTYIQLSYWDIALAATLLTINAGLSIYYRLGTERRLLLAAARMVVQLTLVGLVLKALFHTVSPWLTLLVALPGMMTGQILAGVEPVEAVKYQILIMFLIAGGTALGVFSATRLALLRLTDSRQRLRLDRLKLD